jgi:threonylcarbamoyladenosine tRNA methylthiotransferase MtaB
MPTFHIEQFGCRATQADGAAIERQLLQRGYTLGAKNSADIVVINTCTVTAAADAQARDAIRKIRDKNYTARLVVTGCYAQRAPEELALLPGVAWVVGNSHKAELPEIIEKLSVNSPTVNFVPLSSLEADIPRRQMMGSILVGEFERKPLLSAPVFGGEGNHTRPTLKIQDGCDSRCSYCVIPHVRGKSRSLPVETVVQEINRLTAAGSREIVLSGINLGTYGRDLDPRTTLLDLLRRILDGSPVERLRVSSIEPMDVTKDLVDFFAASNRLAQHFHMPLQSGTDRILAAMHRWYRAEQYARRVEIIRERLPHAAIGADVIAGFPGETAPEHDSTIAFIKSLPFSYLHVFSFSKRPGTGAAKLSNEVPPDVIKNRARELRALGDSKAAAFRREHIGMTMRVLTLRSREDNDPVDLSTSKQASTHEIQWTPALSSNYLRVRVSGAFSANQWLNVRISGAASDSGNNVIAETEEAPQTLPAAANCY